ncbi:MAG: hypothetical protein ACFFED_15880 [Candidatus Thorarchaeota archaeon]
MQNEMRNIIVSFIALLIGVAIFFLSSPPWTTAGSASVYYSVLAFLCITITVGSRNRIRTDPSPAHSFFSAGTLYASIVFGGAAIFYVYAESSPVTHLYTAGVFLNLVAFATTGISMILYAYLQKYPPSEKSIWNKRYITLIYVLVSITAFVILLILTRSYLNQTIFLSWGYFVGLLALMTYIGAAYLTYTSRVEYRGGSHEPVRLSISFGLLAGASLIHLTILPSPNILWIISIALMAIAFIYAIVATGYAFLLDIDVERSVAYGIAVAISVLVVIPFLLTQLVEGFVTTLPVEQTGAAMLIHLGGCVFAGSLAYLLYIKSQNYRNTYVFPIIAIFLFWTMAEVVVFFSHLVPFYETISETRVPYISGSIVSIIFLVSAVRQILNPNQRTIKSYELSRFGYLAVIFGTMMILGEIIQKMLFDIFPEVFTGQFGTALMLGLSYISLFILLDFFLLLAGSSGGRITFDTLAVGSLSIWLVITIMKANFSVWTVGYWAAESVLAISFLTFPILLLYYFLAEYRQNIVMETNATIYSKFLTRRIGTHHGTAIDALENMTKESTLNDKRLESISFALQEVSFAEELTQTMASVLEENRFDSRSMEAMDLVDIIIVAVDRLIEHDKELPQIKINKERGSCYVIGNSLLVDTFQKLFEGVIQRIGNVRGLDIQIAQEKFDIKPSWHTDLTIEVTSQDASKSKLLFDRYTKREWTMVPELAFCYRLIQLFGGKISAESILGASTQLWLIVKITLPSTPAI